jgi:hypothetical protein
LRLRSALLRRLSQWRSKCCPTSYFSIVLVIEIRNTPDWPASISAQETQIKRRTDAALAGSDVSKARSKVYWISVIGPHWRYGDRDEDEQDLRPLIDWRHTTHDQDSYEHLQDLAGLVGSFVTV